MYTADNEHFPSGGCCQKHFLQKQNLALLRNLSDMGSTFTEVCRSNEFGMLFS